MKIMVASDLHGSSFFIEKLIERYEKEKCEKLILLGDLLYFNPRVSDPELFNRKKSAYLLNSLEDDIIAVRGNCDSYNDDRLLYFDMTHDHRVYNYCDRKIYLTHGHYYGEYDPPHLDDGDILITGHTHVPDCVCHGFWYLNPGSVSLPKKNSWHGYMVFEDGTFTWKDLGGEVKMSFDMNKEKQIINKKSRQV